MTDDPDPIPRASSGRSALALLWLARGVALVALGVSAYLLWTSVAAGGQVAGCGGAGSGCGQVLTSRWSQWLRLPVALPAVAAYAAALAALWLVQNDGSWAAVRAWQGLVFLAALLVGSACWFLAVQLFMLQSFCAYCVTVHVCGLLLAGFVFGFGPVPWRTPAAVALLLAGLAGAGALVAGQLLVDPRLPDMRVTARVELADGTLTFDVDKYPRLGPPTARYVLVDLFDYTCPHCRVTSGYLEQARRRYGDQFAVLPLVVPYHPDCNPFVPGASPLHVNACDYARLSLAVWRAKPEACETFHLWLIEATTTPEAARKYAEELVGADELKRALADTAWQRQLQEHVMIYGRFGGSTLPILLHGAAVAQGQPAGAQQLFDFLEKDGGLRPVDGAPTR